jgi:hypothetical protein
LDHHFLDVAPVRILSSGLWNDVTAGKSDLGRLYSPQHYSGMKAALNYVLILTPNFFMLQDSARGYEEAFVPKRVELLEKENVPQPESTKDDTQLTKKILEAVSSYEDATRGSVVSYLALEEPREEVERVIDELLTKGYLSGIGKDVKRASPLHAMKVTEAGYALLKSLS